MHLLLSDGWYMGHRSEWEFPQSLKMSHAKVWVLYHGYMPTLNEKQDSHSIAEPEYMEIRGGNSSLNSLRNNMYDIKTSQNLCFYIM